MAAEDEPKAGRAGPESSAPSAREPAAGPPAREPTATPAARERADSPATREPTAGPAAREPAASPAARERADGSAAGERADSPAARERADGPAARERAARAAPASAPQAQREPGPPPPREMRSPLDLVPEILRRGLSAGRDVSESLIPRELASNLAAQLVDARHGLVNAIASEVGRFLRQADIASEMRKVLAGLHVEAKIQLRFSEDPSGKLQTQVETERASARKASKPPPPDSSG